MEDMQTIWVTFAAWQPDSKGFHCNTRSQSANHRSAQAKQLQSISPGPGMAYTSSKATTEDDNLQGYSTERIRNLSHLFKLATGSGHHRTVAENMVR